MDYIEALVGFASGIAATVLPRFFRSKKENDEFLLELVRTLRNEVDRMHVELERVRTDYDKKLVHVQNEYNTLLTKYNTLKKDFTDYKNQQNP